MSNGLLAVSAAALMAACGGGGDGNASAGGSAGGSGSPVVGTVSCETPPEGFQPFATVQAAVGGTIIGRQEPSFILLQAPDAVARGFDRWLIYGPDLAQASVITGVIYAGGGVWCSSTDRTARNGSDWGASIDGVYLRTQIADSGSGATLLGGGSLRYTAVPTATYALEPRPLPGIAPNHALAPAMLANAVGSWALNNSAGNGISLDVAANGALTLSYPGCSLTGNLRVGDGGTYSVTAQEDRTSCSNPWSDGVGYEGVALTYPLATGGWQFVIALTSGAGDELVAIGRR
jgi:hypothetical protein